MANSTKTPTKPRLTRPQDVPVTNPNNVKSVYANFFGVSATMTDFTIIFLELGRSPGAVGDQNQTNEVKAIVTLPMAAVEGLQQVLKQLTAQMLAAQTQAAMQLAQKTKDSAK